jgi:hypothetical protein
MRTIVIVRNQHDAVIGFSTCVQKVARDAMPLFQHGRYWRMMRARRHAPPLFAPAQQQCVQFHVGTTKFEEVSKFLHLPVKQPCRRFRATRKLCPDLHLLNSVLSALERNVALLR